MYSIGLYRADPPVLEGNNKVSMGRASLLAVCVHSVVALLTHGKLIYKTVAQNRSLKTTISCLTSSSTTAMPSVSAGGDSPQLKQTVYMYIYIHV